MNLPPQLETKFQQLETRYPVKRSALIPMLIYAQDQFGYVSDEMIDEIAGRLDLKTIQVIETMEYYSMLRRKRVGKYHVQVCTNVSCMLRGGYQVLEALEQKLGIQRGETTADGEFTLIEEECLAACADAPCLIAGQKYHLRLTPETAVAALDEIKKQPTTHSPSGEH